MANWLATVILSLSEPRANKQGFILSNLKCVSQNKATLWDAQPPRYQNTHLTNSEDRESFNVSPRVHYQLRKPDTVSGNCPLWECVKRNNGSSVFCWKKTVLLPMSSRLRKHNIYMLWNTIIREIKTYWSTKTTQALRSDHNLQRYLLKSVGFLRVCNLEAFPSSSLLWNCKDFCFVFNWDAD